MSEVYKSLERSKKLRDLRINKIPIFEREGWQRQPSLSKIGILFSCKSLGALLCRGDKAVIRPHSSVCDSE